MEKEIKNYLLSLAKNTIAKELGLKAEELKRPKDEILNEKRGVFVTLEEHGALRGCIGNIEPVYPLEEAVKRNAFNAGFGDPRFDSVSSDEFEDLEIEISVLTVPKKLEYKNFNDLLKKLRPLKDGVVLKKGYYEATYLPQVWEKLSDKEEFLSSLCMKAGLSADEWRKDGLEVFTYEVELFRDLIN